MRSPGAPRLPPERPAFPVQVLPICPRPYPQEAARSWLTRVGRVYALNPERLVGILGLVPFEPGSSSEPVPRISEKHTGCNLRLTPTVPFERYRPSSTLHCDVRRSGGDMYRSPNRTAAATLPKWDFPHGSGICCGLNARSACIGLWNV
jgi:hypothetical protein